MNFYSELSAYRPWNPQEAQDRSGDQVDAKALKETEDKFEDCEAKLQEMEERIFQRLMKQFTVEVRNEASPAIKEIKEEIDKLFVSK